MIKEFKEFIAKGNVIDLAVGLILGSAFTAIVNSLVKDVITPIITALTGNAKLEELSFKVGTATLTYGNFIQAIINFFLTALVLFFIVRSANSFRRKKAAENKPAPAPKETNTEIYLKEIRDLINKK